MKKIEIMLSDRLKDTTKSQINKASEQFPTLVENLMEALETTLYVGELKYTNILDLKYFCNTDNPFTLFHEGC